MAVTGFWTTQIRANMPNLGSLDALLAQQMEELYTDFAGNRWAMSFTNFFGMPTWYYSAGLFGFSETLEFTIPWEQQIGFERIEATVFLLLYQQREEFQIKLKSSTWIEAHTAQEGPYATARYISDTTAGTYNTNTPNGYFSRYMAKCELEFPDGYASDRRMLLSFELNNETVAGYTFISGLYIEDKAPARNT